MKVIVTGGSGFIGSCLVKKLILDENVQVLNIDKLTYAVSPSALQPACDHLSYQFIQADISDAALMEKIIFDFKPDIIFHLAAESHVDRSIAASAPFIQSNIVGTHSLLEASEKFRQSNNAPKNFRFISISTDEVYGSLDFNDSKATETSLIQPSSPYSASKASADMLVQAWQKTYNFPAIITRCTNNYGEFQNDEKLIPTIIRSAINNQPIPIYGTGNNIRDWLYVGDHCDALIALSKKGALGHTYNISGSSPLSNSEIAHQICDILNQLLPKNNKAEYQNQITYVKDRLGHDIRYALDDNKINTELNWSPKVNFNEGLKATVKWYLKEYNEGNNFSGGQWNQALPSNQNSI